MCEIDWKSAASGRFADPRRETGLSRRREKNFGLKARIGLRVCKPLVLMLVQMRIQNGNPG